MEKLLKPYDKEYMKMAMLKHEETFKHQVYELHRLYRIQKILMKRIENQERWDSSNHHEIDQKPRPEPDGDGQLEVEDESEIQLTLGPKSYYRTKKLAETPPSLVSGRSFSSSSSGSSHVMNMKRTSSGTHQEEFTGHQWGRLTMVPGIQSARMNSFNVEEQLSRDRLKQHPWIFQALSMNMT